MALSLADHVNGYPDKAKEVMIKEKSGKTDTYMEFNDLEAIESAIQMDTIEFQPWISKYIPGQPEHASAFLLAETSCPTSHTLSTLIYFSIYLAAFLMFDLDAGPGTSFDTLSFVAHKLRDALESFGLKSYPLLTGSTVCVCMYVCVFMYMCVCV